MILILPFSKKLDMVKYYDFAVIFIVAKDRGFESVGFSLCGCAHVVCYSFNPLTPVLLAK